jgi:porin
MLMKTTRVIGTTLFLFVISSGLKLGAQEAPPANSYSGDFWTRSTLSGDWGGLRNDLAAKGITIDMSLTQAAQGIVGGGKDTGWQYSGGRGDINFLLDTRNSDYGPEGF